MSASAALRGVFRTPVARPAFRQTEPGDDFVRQQDSNQRIDEARAHHIASILRQSSDTVRQISAHTAKRYGIRSPYFIPPTFLSKVRRGITPHVCQVAALSERTGYRFLEWMHLFGFDLRQIPFLQVRLHGDRTVLVTPVNFKTTTLHAPSSIESFLSPSSSSLGFQRWRWSITSPTGGPQSLPPGKRHCLAKIGHRDALILPQLVPGLLVSVDRGYRQRMDDIDDETKSKLLWLVEHPGGLTCCHIKWLSNCHIVLYPVRPPFGHLPLSVPTEASILGLVDLHTSSLNSPASHMIENASILEDFPEPVSFSSLLRSGRRRTGLTFRAAHQLTCTIADTLADRDYAIGLGLLSDYEAIGRLPRHIAKLISLCITYSLDIGQLLESVGLHINDSNKLSLPVINSLFDLACDVEVEEYRTIGLGEGTSSVKRQVAQ